MLQGVLGTQPCFPRAEVIMGDHVVPSEEKGLVCRSQAHDFCPQSEERKSHISTLKESLQLVSVF